MASAELSRPVEKVVGYPPLCEMAADQRRVFQEAARTEGFEELGWRLCRGATRYVAAAVTRPGCAADA
jgi:hypothetical protein